MPETRKDHDPSCENFYLTLDSMQTEPFWKDHFCLTSRAGFERNISPYVRQSKNNEQDRNSVLSLCPQDRSTDFLLAGSTVMYLVSLENSSKMQENGVYLMLISLRPFELSSFKSRNLYISFRLCLYFAIFLLMCIDSCSSLHIISTIWQIQANKGFF